MLKTLNKKNIQALYQQIFHVSHSLFDIGTDTFKKGLPCACSQD